MVVSGKHFQAEFTLLKFCFIVVIMGLDRHQSELFLPVILSAAKDLYVT
jgi:hypothetical protein